MSKITLFWILGVLSIALMIGVLTWALWALKKAKKDKII